jgi:hypothetical protein
MTLSPRREKVDRPEIFWEFTRSLCPTCRKVIDAHIRLRNNRMIALGLTRQQFFYLALLIRLAAYDGRKWQAMRRTAAV